MVTRIDIPSEYSMVTDVDFWA